MEPPVYSAAPLIRLSAAATLAVLLAGCVPANAVGGPLNAGGGQGINSEACMIQPPRGMAVFGATVSNTTDKTLVITEVSLTDAQNLELVAADVVALDAENTYALGTGSTEPEEPDAKAAWERREAVESFELEPGQSANILVTVDNGSEAVGSSQGLRIKYEQNLAEFLALSGTALVLQDQSCFRSG